MGGIIGFVWTVIQLMDYFGLTTKSSTPVFPIKNTQQQVVIPKNVPESNNVKIRHSTKQRNPSESASGSNLKVPVQTNLRDLSGSCSYMIKNDSSYPTRFILKHVDKQLGQREMVKIFLPSKSNYTVSQLPEGTFSVNYCIGKGWDATRNDFKSTEGCRDATEILISEVERKLVDGDIIKEKKCEESIGIGDGSHK